MGEKAFYIESGKLRINKRQLKIRLVAVLIIFIAVFFFGEITVRIFDPQILYDEHNPAHPSYPKEVEYDRELGWSTLKDYKARPHTYQGRNPVVTITHNSQGYRMDHEVDESKNILVMTGDSLTYGFWVDDKKIVSAQLNELLGDEWEVINMGVGGYGTGQSFLRFIRDGLKHKPKVVVHTLFNNDFSNILSSYQYNVYKPVFELKGNELKVKNVPVPISPDMELSYPTEREHAFPFFERIMRSWSHLYVLYKTKVSDLKGTIIRKFKPEERQDYFKAYKDGEFWAIEREYSDTMNRAFLLNSMILRTYRDVAKENDAKFIFVVIGDRISVDEDMQKATIDKYYNVDEDFFDFKKPYKLLESFAEAENITAVNLYPLFKEEFSKGKTMYLEGDHHLNDYGHELFGREVHKAMMEEGII